MAKYDVFISYAHLDKERVLAIYDFLIGKKVECYIDLKTHHGTIHRDVHQEAISQSQKVVCFFSENSISGNRLREEIDYELKTAKELGKTVIPFAFDRAFDYYSIPYLKGVSILYQDEYQDAYPEILLEDIKEDIQLLEYIRDEETAEFIALQQKANEGNSDKQIEMGNRFRKGKPVQPDYNKAIEWYLKAAQWGDEDSYMLLGDCFLNLVLPTIERYSNNCLDANFREAISYAVAKAKRSEEWFYKAAISSKHDINGLLELCEKTRWLSFYCPESLPTNRVFDAFSSYSFEDSRTGYRLCKLMFSLSCEMENYLEYDDTEPEITYSDDGEIEISGFTGSIKPDVLHVAQRAIELLEKWADRGEIHALLFLSSAFLNLKPDVVPYLAYEPGALYERAISLLNQAYHLTGENLFRYRLSDYGIRDVDGELFAMLLNQDSPNLIGLQLKMEQNIFSIDRWEEVLTGWELSKAEQFYYLGLGALRVDMSFAAMWFTKASKAVSIEAKRMLGDYFSERLEVYNCGITRKIGSIDNVLNYLEKGVSSGDPSLDSLAEMDRDYIRSVAKSQLVNVYLSNVSKAAVLYRDYGELSGNTIPLGWCYYWGLGVRKDPNMALKYGYSATQAEIDRPGLEPMLDAIAQHKREEEDLKAWVEDHLNVYDDETNVIDVNSPADPDSYKRDTDEFLKRMREKVETWKEQFQDIPCPYESIISKFKDIIPD